MIFRINLFKLNTNLCKFHSNLIKNKSLLKFRNNFNNYNNLLIKLKSSNSNNNSFRSEFEDKNGLILKDIYKFQDSEDRSSSMNDMKTHSQNILNFNESNTNGANSYWFDILSKAEQLVKYPTSFLSLRFLLKDEISYLAIHLKRLIDTKHPLLETAKY